MVTPARRQQQLGCHISHLEGVSLPLPQQRPVVVLTALTSPGGFSSLPPPPGVSLSPLPLLLLAAILPARPLSRLALASYFRALPNGVTPRAVSAAWLRHATVSCTLASVGPDRISRTVGERELRRDHTHPGWFMLYRTLQWLPS